MIYKYFLLFCSKTRRGNWGQKKTQDWEQQGQHNQREATLGSAMVFLSLTKLPLFTISKTGSLERDACVFGFCFVFIFILNDWSIHSIGMKSLVNQSHNPKSISIWISWLPYFSSRISRVKLKLLVLKLQGKIKEWTCLPLIFLVGCHFVWNFAFSL